MVVQLLFQLRILLHHFIISSFNEFCSSFLFHHFIIQQPLFHQIYFSISSFHQSTAHISLMKYFCSSLNNHHFIILFHYFIICKKWTTTTISSFHYFIIFFYFLNDIPAENWPNTNPKKRKRCPQVCFLSQERFCSILANMTMLIKDERNVDAPLMNNPRIPCVSRLRHSLPPHSLAGAIIFGSNPAGMDPPPNG